MSDPISGTWAAGNGIFMRLSWDGRDSLTGVVPLGGPTNIVTSKRGTFDPATGAMSLEGDGRHPRTGVPVQFSITGKVSGTTLSITARLNDETHEATLAKVTFWSAVTSLVQRIFRPIQRRAEGLPPYVPGPLNREQLAALRRTKAQNEQAMRERAESVESLVFRDATEADIPALAQLHVVTWAATYPDVYAPPTFAIRSWQWRDAFRKPDANQWFVIVIENSRGQLVGFLRGIRGGDRNDNGDVNKIYLLDEYQRMGLGSRMLGRACRRFMQMGVKTMTVHAEADNPSCAFYAATGGVNIVNDKGETENGNYVWRDLAALSAQCPD